MEVAGRAALITVCNKRSRERTARRQCCQPRLSQAASSSWEWAAGPEKGQGVSRGHSDSSGVGRGRGDRATQPTVLAPITQNRNDAVDNGRS